MSWEYQEIGKLQETRGEVLSVRWKIDQFLALSGPRSCYESPYFSFSGSTWCLLVYLRHTIKSESSEWVALYLKRKDVHFSKIVTFEFALKKADGTSSFQRCLTREFKGDASYGFESFLARSELLDRKYELTKSDAITFTCLLRNLPPPVELTTFGFGDLLDSKQHSDVTIQVEDQVFEAHKNILAASSQVFSAMFEHDMAEKSSGVVSIPDCDPGSFKDFLHFLYDGRTSITGANVYHLYGTAHKYCVQELVTHCVAFMVKNLCVESVCDVAALGSQYSDDNLIGACKGFFEENIREIFQTSQWKSFLQEHHLVAYELLNDVAPKITVNK